jgi:hypothetical protein
VIAPISLVASIPAFYFLYKRKRIFVWDYGLVIYVLAVWTFLQCIFKPLFGSFGILDLFIEGTAIAILSIGAQYLKLLPFNGMTAKMISWSSIGITILITILIYFLTP